MIDYKKNRQSQEMKLRIKILYNVCQVQCIGDSAYVATLFLLMDSSHIHWIICKADHFAFCNLKYFQSWIFWVAVLLSGICLLQFATDIWG